MYSSCAYNFNKLLPVVLIRISNKRINSFPFEGIFVIYFVFRGTRLIPRLCRNTENKDPAGSWTVTLVNSRQVCVRFAWSVNRKPKPTGLSPSFLFSGYYVVQYHGMFLQPKRESTVTYYAHKIRCPVIHSALHRTSQSQKLLVSVNHGLQIRWITKGKSCSWYTKQACVA